MAGCCWYVCGLLKLGQKHSRVMFLFTPYCEKKISLGSFVAWRLKGTKQIFNNLGAGRFFSQYPHHLLKNLYMRKCLLFGSLSIVPHPVVSR
jgi:hypothetical protein